MLQASFPSPVSCPPEGFKAPREAVWCACGKSGTAVKFQAGCQESGGEPEKWVRAEPHLPGREAGSHRPVQACASGTSDTPGGSHFLLCQLLQGYDSRLWKWKPREPRALALKNINKQTQLAYKRVRSTVTMEVMTVAEGPWGRVWTLESHCLDPRPTPRWLHGLWATSCHSLGLIS